MRRTENSQAASGIVERHPLSFKVNAKLYQFIDWNRLNVDRDRGTKYDVREHQARVSSGLRDWRELGRSICEGLECRIVTNTRPLLRHLFREEQLCVAKTPSNYKIRDLGLKLKERSPFRRCP